jgi:hypothetical protein
VEWQTVHDIHNPLLWNSHGRNLDASSALRKLPEESAAIHLLTNNKRPRNRRKKSSGVDQQEASKPKLRGFRVSLLPQPSAVRRWRLGVTNEQASFREAFRSRARGGKRLSEPNPGLGGSRTARIVRDDLLERLGPGATLSGPLERETGLQPVVSRQRVAGNPGCLLILSRTLGVLALVGETAGQSPASSGLCQRIAGA